MGIQDGAISNSSLWAVPAAPFHAETATPADTWRQEIGAKRATPHPAKPS